MDRTDNRGSTTSRSGQTARPRGLAQRVHGAWAEPTVRHARDSARDCVSPPLAMDLTVNDPSSERRTVPGGWGPVTRDAGALTAAVTA
jgi:hypothetical protein